MVAVVTVDHTVIEDFESATDNTIDYGSGTGGGDQVDNPFKGNRAIGRKADNWSGSPRGIGEILVLNVDLTVNNDTHLKFWIYSAFWVLVTNVHFRIRDASANDDDHEVPTSMYPLPVGSWIPVFIDMSRTPEKDGGADLTDVDQLGILCNMPNIAGANTHNWVLDEVTTVTDGITITGTASAFSDIVTFEENDSNKFGNLLKLNGILFCYSRILIGTSLEVGFIDAGFTLVWPDVTLCAETFLGITFDLSNASTVINLSGGTIQSSAPDDPASNRRPDFLVTGLNGSLTLNNMVISGMRIIELNSQCITTNSILSNNGSIDATSSGTTGADLSGSNVFGSRVAADESAIIWNVNEDPDGKLNDMTFNQGGNDHHAIDFGTNVINDITLRGIEFSNFDDTSGEDQPGAALRFLAASGSLNCNLAGCTVNGAAATASNFFKDDTAGIAVTLVFDPRTATFLCLDGSQTPPVAIENVNVLIEAVDGTGDLPFEDVVTLEQTGGLVTASHTGHNMADGDLVVIREAAEKEYNGTFPISNVTANDYDYTIQGNPSSPATGTILASGAVVFGRTDSNGEIADTRTWGNNQPIKGTGRKKTSEPVFETGNFTGTISNAGDTTLTAIMQPD